MGDGVVVVDTNGELVHHNPAARTILGARFEAFLPGKGSTASCFQQLDQGGMCTIDDLPLARAIRGSSSENVELYCDGRHGAEQWISVTANPLRNAEQDILGGVAVIRDFSAENRSDILLRVC
jgi:PAS domain S-box-containing protein